MPFALKLTRKWTDRYALIVLSGLLPIVLGIFIIFWQANRALELKARHTADEAVRQFDLMLDNAALSADVVLPLAGQNCPQVELALREQVTRRPFVRSVNLVWNDQIYCTSLFGDFKETVNPGNYVNGTLWLMKGNPVTPDEPVLVYRREDGHRSVLVSLYGFHLVNVLGLINAKTLLLIQVGDTWIDRYGKVSGSALPAYEVARTLVSSESYPYKVVAGFGTDEIWQVAVTEYPALFALLLFLGSVSAVTVQRLQKRSSSPSHELQRGLDAGEFIPYFQAIVHSGNKQWAGAEVLMRWQHPREGLVRPDLFIPFAEHSGLIIPMTRSLMQQTAVLLGPYAKHMEPGFHLAFNITAHHCQDLELIEDCRHFLQAFPPRHIKLVLELTERELIVPTEITHQLFAALHELGVMIAIDDFGTGHSSLSYLRTFNVDYLKIDQSFVSMIGVDALSRHILDSVIELSAKLNLGIVAEGVENKEQSDYLTEKGVEYLQGYLFARPLIGDQFITSLLTRFDKRA